MRTQMAEGKFGRPDSTTVREFHVNADTDVTPDALHHTLGPGVNQAASGAHAHDGNDSALLLEGQSITGTKATAAWASSINALMVRLGATDSST
jgi:hypothetical protein